MKSMLCVAAAVLVACNPAAWPAVHRTTAGVESTLPATLDDVEARARTALAEWDVVVDAALPAPPGQSRRVLVGTVHDLRVTIAMDREGPTTTRAEVKVWRNATTWDRRFARALMDRIIVLG